MPAEEEGFHSAVVREEPTRKPRTNSTSIRPVHPKRGDAALLRVQRRCMRVHNHQYPDTRFATSTARSDMSPALPPASPVPGSRRVGPRWMTIFTLAWLAIWTVQLTPVQLLLPLQLDTAEDDWISGVISSGFVLGIGGLAGIVAGPMAGALSDRARVGRRRRRPWAIDGVLVTACSWSSQASARAPGLWGPRGSGCRSASRCRLRPSPR